MGDSDDDGDYKRRDKFRTERGDGYSDGVGAPRREWRDDPGRGGMPPSGGSGTGAGWGGRGDRRDGAGPPHRAYPPRRERYEDRSMSPPPKRMREWEDRYDGRGSGRYDGGYHDRYDRPHDMYNAGGGGYGRGRGGGYFPRGGYNGPMHHDRHSDSGRGGVETSDGTQPTMMSFKTFLGTQDDTISDEEAIKKYAEYKLEFKRQQLNEFFVSHKDEEWKTDSSVENSSTEDVHPAQLDPTATILPDNSPNIRSSDSLSLTSQLISSQIIIKDLVLVILLLRAKFKIS